LEKFIRLGGGGGGTVAKDALGNDIVVEQWLKTHGPGDRTLSQGLKVLAASFFSPEAHVFLFHFPILLKEFIYYGKGTTRFIVFLSNYHHCIYLVS
jgi:hypothetical protein